ncbi:hypothetical protein DQ384_38690 [Sphaerisporangium album]|uniref:Aminoglycoside phosphotransferase domain-containing protein n=2 Tax=Sphaerisporangium album TaxID=509200 RepID=A0A367ELS4_9ACTN|nr:hypothetical protein DQ384_38690 [Sphaerisporangium album]
MHTETPEVLAGDHLLHTDWNPRHVLIDEKRAHLVGWSYPTLGAAWIDPACWLVWLIQAGHNPSAAERAAARAPSWDTASRDALDSFSATQVSFWTSLAHEKSDPRANQLAAAARRWASHRQQLKR